MPGVAGMGSTKQVAPIDPTLPPVQGVQIPQQAVPVQQAAPAEDDFSSLINGALAESPQQEEDFSGLIDQELSTVPEEEFTTDYPSAMDRLGEVPARAKASFAVSNKELLQSLQQSFGEKNVRKADGYSPEIEYKGKDGKWRTWDAGTSVEDFTVDLARPVVEEIPATVGTLAAGIPSAASMIASGGLSTPAAVAATAAARAGGAVVGQATGDFVQSQILGIDKDPARNTALEYGTAALLAPVAGGLADFATKKIAQRAAVAEARKLMAPKDLYKAEIGSIKESLDVVKQLGGMENIPGTDTPLMLSMYNPSNPIAKEITEDAARLGGFKQAQEMVSQGFEDSSKAFLSSLGNLDAKSTGSEFKSYIQQAVKQEGQAIGGVRDALVDAAGSGELPVPKLKGKIEAFAQEIGFDLKGNTNIAGLKSYLVDEMGYSKQAAEVIVNKTNKLLERVTNKEGRMTAKEIVGTYEEMNGLYKNVIKGGSETSPLFRQKVGELRRYLADELIDKTEVVLDPVAKKAYQGNLTRFKELVEASDEFSGLLEKDTLASHSLSKAIFSKGSNGLDTANAAKTLLRDRPDLLDDVKGSYLNDLVAKNFNSVSGKTDWNRVNKELLSPELKPIINTMFGDSAIDGLKAYQVVGKAIQDGTVGPQNSAKRAAFVRELSKLGSVVESGKAAADALFQADPDKTLAKILSKEGIDDFIKTAPKDKKPFLKKALSFLQQTALRSAQGSEMILRRNSKKKSKDDANQINSENEL